MNEDKIVSMLTTLIVKMDDFEEGQKKLMADVSEIKERVTSLETKVTSLETKVTSLETKVTSLEAKVTSLETKVASLETDVSEVKTRVISLETKVTSLEKTASEINNHIITMEYDNHQQFVALFDGYTQLYQISSQIRAGQERLEALQDSNALQILHIKHSRKLG